MPGLPYEEGEESSTEMEEYTDEENADAQARAERYLQRVQQVIMDYVDEDTWSYEAYTQSESYYSDYENEAEEDTASWAESGEWNDDVVD